MYLVPNGRPRLKIAQGYSNMAGKRKGFGEERQVQLEVLKPKCWSASAPQLAECQAANDFSEVWRSRTGRDVGGGVAVSCARAAAVDDGGLIG